MVQEYFKNDDQVKREQLTNFSELMNFMSFFNEESFLEEHPEYKGLFDTIKQVNEHPFHETINTNEEVLASHKKWGWHV